MTQPECPSQRARHGEPGHRHGAVAGRKAEACQWGELVHRGGRHGDRAVAARAARVGWAVTVTVTWLPVGF